MMFVEIGLIFLDVLCAVRGIFLCVELVRSYHGHILSAVKDMLIVGRIAVHFFTKDQI